MRAQFADLMVDVSSALEKLNTMAARFAKRESRAAARQLELAATEPEGPAELDADRRPNHGNSKRDLYARLREKRQHRAAGG